MFAEEQRFISDMGTKAHKRYLKEHKRAVYITLLTSGRLNSYLADIEGRAQERFEQDRRADETGTRDYRAAKGRKSDGMGSENE